MPSALSPDIVTRGGGNTYLEYHAWRYDKLYFLARWKFFKIIIKNLLTAKQKYVFVTILITKEV